MSQENVEVVERAIAAINARDIDGYLACCTEDVVLRTPLAEITGVCEGADGIKRFLVDVEDSAPDFRINLERVESVGASRVLAFMQITATGRSSGIPQDAPTANVYDLVDGKIKRIRIFLDRTEALKAVGLAEQAMSQANVEVVRRGIEAAIRQPKPDFATLDGLYHPDHEFISLLDALEGGTHRGARGYRDWRLDAQDTFPWETTLEKVTEIDADRVLAIMPTRSRGSSSGVVLDQRLAGIVTVRDGKIIRTEVYPSPEEALKAVGLAE